MSACDIAATTTEYPGRGRGCDSNPAEGCPKEDVGADSEIGGHDTTLCRGCVEHHPSGTRRCRIHVTHSK